jgi:hypothetical protein
MMRSVMVSGSKHQRMPVANLPYLFPPRPTPQLGGYIATFDLRDPGNYTLQVVVAWYFGASDPPNGPRPQLVGPFMGYRYNACSHTRASIDGGSVGAGRVSVAFAGRTAH